MAESPADELRIRIHQHLKKHPLLTVFEVSRALLESETRVRRRLRAMEADGEAERQVTPKGPGTSKPVTRWTAT